LLTPLGEGFSPVAHEHHLAPSVTCHDNQLPVKSDHPLGELHPFGLPRQKRHLRRSGVVPPHCRLIAASSALWLSLIIRS
jgi:hypothetical protein